MGGAGAGRSRGRAGPKMALNQEAAVAALGRHRLASGPQAFSHGQVWISKTHNYGQVFCPWGLRLGRRATIRGSTGVPDGPGAILEGIPKIDSLGVKS